jgi:YVTN family beta-propeller protein
VGEALVEPPAQGGGYFVALDVHLVAGEATTINLVWRPGSVPTAGNPYQMNWQVAHFPKPPLGSLVFVTERETGSVMIIDRPGGRVVDAITVGENPGGMAYSAQRQKLYVAVSGADGLGVVDGMTLRLERLVPLNFGDEPDRLALSPDESVLYVLNEGSRSLAAIATRSMQEQFRTTVGDGPRSLAVDPRTGYIYVACEYEGEVQVFNPAGLTPLSSLLLTAAPVEVVIAETSRELFVASSSQNRIHGQNLDDGRELGASSLCGPARFLIYNPRSAQLLAAMPSCAEIAVLRPANGLEFAPFSLLGTPGQMALDTGHRQLLIIFGQTATLGIYDANRGSLVNVVELGGRPHAVIAP